MKPFDHVEFHKKAPVYQQLAEVVKRAILNGTLKNQEELPSRRELALFLSINPNTVQKAYKLLEDEGIIRTISNVKSIVFIDPNQLEEMRQKLIQQQVKEFIKECKSYGMNFQNMIALLSNCWEEI